MKQDIFQVDVFTDTPFAGTPAGVVPRADGIDVGAMQGIAKEMNVSETVFIFHKDLPEGCTYRARFFSPTVEVDYCGHGTIAAAHLLRELEIIPKNIHTVRQAMNRDTWEVSVEGDLNWIRQGPGEFRNGEVDRGELASLLGLDPKFLKEIAWASMGNPVFLCEISDRKTLDTLKPNWDGLVQFSRNHEIMGFHCYALEPHDSNNHLTARVFAPAYGVNEDPATGSTTSSLALYLLSKRKVNPRNGILRIEQGVAMGRPSLLYARMAAHPKGSYVEVGGRAVTVLSGLIQL